MTTLASPTGGVGRRGATRPPSRPAALLGILLLALTGCVAAPAAQAPPPVLADSLATALAEAEAATAARPDDLAAWQRLGTVATRRAAALGDPALYDLAGDAFDRADELASDHPDTLLGRGALSLSLHAFPDALDLGRRALAALPGSPQALGVVVDAQVELGRYDEAAATLQQMLDLRPDLPALSRTSYLRQLHGDLDGAVDAMRQAETAGSGTPFDLATVTALLGDLRLQQGDLDAAQDAYERAERTAAGLVPASVGRARVLAARGDRAAAIVLLQEVVARSPQPGAAVLLGELQALEGRDREAADTFELVRAMAALQERSGQVTDLEMALFEADHGDPAVAVTRAEAAHAERPDNVYAADALAWALHRAGRQAEAVALVERAVRLDTADAALQCRAALVLAAADRLDDARGRLARTGGSAPLCDPSYAGELAHLQEERS